MRRWWNWVTEDGIEKIEGEKRARRRENDQQTRRNGSR